MAAQAGVRPAARARRDIRWGSVAFKALAYVLLALMVLSTLFPFFWMVSTSLKQEQRVFRIPMEWIPNPVMWENYTYIFTTMPFGSFVANSFKVSILSCLGEILSCSLAAYAFARIPFPGRNTLFVIILGTMMVPFQVRMIPTYLVMHRLHWIDTHLPLWVPAWMGGAYGTFLVRQYMLTLPQELMDAAKIDGCTHFGTYWRIVMPLAKPVLATLALLGFMFSWNSLLGPLLYLNTESKFTLTLALTRFRGHNYTYWTKMMAGATISLIPVATLFIFTQQYFVQGVTLTGLKG
ncbi:MAG: carbohydrate ABC transporter permease [Anaerolineae bacterium]